MGRKHFLLKEMTKMKKIGILFATIIMMTLFSISASAKTIESSGKCGDNVYWNYDSVTGEIVICGSGEIYDYSYNCDISPLRFISPLKSVIIEDGITYIGDCFFYSCDDITNVTIGNGVTHIGYDAFDNCDALKGVYVSSMESWLNIEFDNLLANPLANDADLYFNNELVDFVTIPINITVLNDYVFFNCYSLKSITIPNHVTTIGKNCFYKCEKLTEVLLDEGVSSIGSEAFRKCTNLRSIKIPDSVINMGYNTFYDCDGLTNVTIGKGVTTIGTYTFCDCDKLENVIIGDSVTTISSDAFYGCNELKSIVISKSVEKILEGAFSACFSLTDVYYTGTQEQWSEMKIHSDNNYLINAKIHFNYCNHYNKIYIQQNPTCTEFGFVSGFYCYDCKRQFDVTELIAPKGHEYENHICKFCGENEVEHCSCACHSTGIIGIVWRIFEAVFKIFNSNPVCVCGLAHY